MRKVFICTLLLLCFFVSKAELIEQTITVDFTKSNYDLINNANTTSEYIDYDGLRINIYNNHQYNDDGYLYLIPNESKPGMMKIYTNKTINAAGIITNIKFNFANSITIKQSNDGGNGFYISVPTSANRNLRINDKDVNIECLNSTNTSTFYVLGNSYNDAKITSIEITYSLEMTDIPTPNVPEFSILSGSYFEPQFISLSSSDSTDQIYYTIDGSSPSDKSSLYSTPIAINSSTIIKAIVKSKYGKLSAVAESNYLIATSHQNIADIADIEVGSPIILATPLTVIHHSGKYLYATDYSNNILLKNASNSYKNGECIKGNTKGIIEVIDVHKVLSITQDEEKIIPVKPIIKTLESIIGEPINHEFITLERCTYVSDTSGNLSTVSQNGRTVNASNLFGIDVPTIKPGWGYFMTGFVSLTETGAVIIPTAIVEDITTAAINAIAQVKSDIRVQDKHIIVNEPTTNIVIYSISGQKISERKNNVECDKGIYVVVVDNVINKVIVN